MQLNANTCVQFDTGSLSAPHSSENPGKLTCDIRSSTTTARCPALPALTRDQGRNTTPRFSPGDGSALSDPGTACAVRSTCVDAGGTPFAPMGEGRDCLGGAAYSLVEEIYMLRDMQPALTKKEQRGFPTPSD
ncbi:hypothetical protein K8353_28170 [Burkholderia contaminans]|nr:hypothetical protein [Burkholderia contaminans]